MKANQDRRFIDTQSNSLVHSGSMSKLKCVSQQNSPKKISDEEDLELECSNTKIVNNLCKVKIKNSAESEKLQIKEHFSLVGQCDKCGSSFSSIEKAIQIVDTFASSMIHRANSIYYKTSIIGDSSNLDFNHSQLFLNLDKVSLPFSLKSSFLSLFVSLLFILEKHQNFREQA